MEEHNNNGDRANNNQKKFKKHYYHHDKSKHNNAVNANEGVRDNNAHQNKQDKDNHNQKNKQPRQQNQQHREGATVQDNKQINSNANKTGKASERDNGIIHQNRNVQLNDKLESEVIFIEEPEEISKSSIPDGAVKVGPPDFDAFEDVINNKKAVVNSDEPCTEVLSVRFRQSGKMYYFGANGIKAREGDHVIVETARGNEYGEVCSPNKMVPDRIIVQPLRPVLRIATKADAEHNEQNRIKEDEALAICAEKIAKHNLEMKLVDTQYTFDNSKLLFYFTAAGRVDFRELVKDLASVFRTRIELRQIGIRDEAKILGGLGACGRPLCCTGFLPDFTQVSIKMAKEQNLSLNSNKISGACGRLMCCLRYENDVYEEEIKKLPTVESIVKTPDGEGIVTELVPLSGMVKVRLNGDNIVKQYGKDDITVIKRAEVEQDIKDNESN